MSNNILVIGNGFDLAHGRKTKYEHFLKWVCEPDEIIKAKYPEKLVEVVFPSYKNSTLMSFFISMYESRCIVDSWIDMEKELHKFIINLNRLIDSLNEGEYKIEDKLFVIRPRSRGITDTYLLSRLVSIFHMDGPDIAINREYIDFWRKIDKEKVFKTIQCELVEISKMLEFYLNSVEPLLHGEIMPLSIINQINLAYVVSFNYTNTIQEIYNFPEERICYVHGRINENNIVLGYDDSDGSLEDLVFKKYYQRLINSTGRIRYEFVTEEDGFGGYHSPDIYFYGHSLDVSDIDILKELFSKGGKVYIYYVDEPDKNEKVKNVIKILGKGSAKNRIETGAIRFCKI